MNAPRPPAHTPQVPGGGSGRATAWLVTSVGVASGGSVLNLLGFLEYVYTATGEALPLGIAVLVNFVPATVLMPGIGRLLRGRDLRSVAIGLCLAQAALAVTMAVSVSVAALLVLLYVQSGLLWLMVHVTRICLMTILPAFVAERQLRRVNLSVQIASQIGAAMAALSVYFVGGVAGPVLLAIGASTFVVQAVVLAAGVPAVGAAGDVAPATPTPPADTHVLRRHWRMVLLLPSGYVTIHTLNVAIPLVIFEQLGADEVAYAAASAVYPASAVLLGLLVRRWGGTSLAVSLVVVAAGWAGFALTGSMGVALVAISVCAVGVVTTNAAGLAWAQADAREDLAAVQSWATALGSAVAAALVLALTLAFQAGHARAAFLALAALFGALVVLARPARDPSAARAPASPGSA